MGAGRGAAKLGRVATGALLAAGAGLLLAAAAGAGDADTFPCAPEGKVVREVAPQAELVEFACYFGPYKERESLHFKVAVKNAGAEPTRFRVNIFLDDGKAVGGLLPRKGKPPVVQPGETASFTYPVQGVDRKPGQVTVVVKTLQP